MSETRVVDISQIVGRGYRAFWGKQAAISRAEGRQGVKEILHDGAVVDLKHHAV